MVRRLFVIIICFISLSLNGNNFSVLDSVFNFKIAQEKVGDNEILYFFSFNNCFYDYSASCFPFISHSFNPSVNPKDIKSEIHILEKRELNAAERNLFEKSNCQYINHHSPIINSYGYRRSPVVQILFNPFVKANNTIYLITKYEIKVYYNEDHKVRLKNNVVTNSVLSTGSWYKIRVQNTGIHKIDYSFLESIGIDVSSINPQNIKIYGNGGGMLPQANSESRISDLKENRIYISGESDSKFDANDYILFYAQGPNVWKYDGTSNLFYPEKHKYSNYNYYFINISDGYGKRVSLSSNTYSSIDNYVNSYDDYQFYENDAINFISSGREWFGEEFDVKTSYNFSFNFPDIDNSAISYLKVSAAARATSVSAFNVNIGGSNQFNINIPSIVIAYASRYASDNVGEMFFKPSSNNLNVNISYIKPNSSALGWLNYIALNVRRHLIYRSVPLMFRDKNTVSSGSVSQFNISNGSSSLIVWDVTEAYNAIEMNSNFVNNTLSFANNSDSIREYVAFERSNNFMKPEFVERTANQNLHGISGVDYIIVTHPNFKSEAIRLGEFHKQHSNLNYVVVTTQEVYNEFSSGGQDITAIRDFVKFVYDKEADTNKAPRYLLLFGDASYDYKNIKPNNTNYVPSFQTLNSFDPVSSIVSDDYFGMLDDSEGYELNGIVDIGIGRFPVQTVQEAKNAVDKVIRYSVPDNNSNKQDNGLGDWRNIVCFIADDQDGNVHIDQADKLAGAVQQSNKNINIDKIYLDSYKQVSAPGGEFYPEAKSDINNRFSRGALIVNYTGHGGVKSLSHERVVEVSDINAWTNYYNMPLMLTATCEFTRFDDLERTSAGEYAFLNNNGGAIALLTTTRLAYSHSNETINTNFYKYAFHKVNNDYLRLGDLIKLTKKASGNAFNYKNFILIGDPAMRLAYPKYNVITDSINGISLDTISAFLKVEIKGYVADEQNNIMNDFNGIIYPTIYDKPTLVKTLQNDNDSKYKEFEVNKSILFKGKVSVTNGYFEFEFIVPKDIDYSYGNGRISYYAQNGTDDASGYFEDFVIGGISDTGLEDKIGPDIKLYMNDTKFVSGGLTNETPILIAYLSDFSGINMTGNGIGHDITATLNNETSKSIILNDYFETELDSYTSGSLRYRLNKLEEGEYTLRLKAWDINNNSNYEEIDFVVASSASFALKQVLNYPNPFTTSTRFLFEHNKPNETLDVQIQIFTISGRVIKTINSIIYTTGTREDGIEWDGLDDYGNSIGKGVYIYRLRLKASDNSFADKIEKLVILK